MSAIVVTVVAISLLGFVVSLGSAAAVWASNDVPIEEGNSETDL